jgi:hypothetical protein
MSKAARYRVSLASDGRKDEKTAPNAPRARLDAMGAFWSPGV